MRSLVFALVLVVAGCGGGGSSSSSAPPPGTDGSVEREILPSTIDPRVNTATEAHIAINPPTNVTASHKLFVFLPGTDGTPAMYRFILRSGAARGFHMLGLNYPNSPAVGLLCNASPDVNCFWDVRREVVTGTDFSNLVDVNDANSIVTRLTKAIGYLDRNYPDEGWGQYLAGGTVDWSKIIVGGHSQGGGHAGVMSKLYAMNRAVYFASPPDWSTFFSAPASWESLPNTTPASRQFGFTHLQDDVVPYSDLSVIWQNMGLTVFGSPVSVDSNNPPYSSSHVLTTQAKPNTGGGSFSPTHGATVLDAATPIAADGVPLFDPAWAYLCFQ